jgi:hypothetical protein
MQEYLHPYNTQSDLFVRYDQAMTSLAGTFSEDEKVLLALYWSANKDIH